MATKRGFTLIELLVTVAIMGLMLSLLVPMVDRSLGKNRVATDAEIFRSKIEEVRLLSGSTQQTDETPGSNFTYDETGYYGIWFHSDAYRSSHYDIVRLSYPLNASGAPCKPGDVQLQAWNQDGPCFVERVNMSKGVTLSCKICGDTAESRSNHFVVFRVPTRQMFHIRVEGSAWIEEGPVFGNPLLELTFTNKKATVAIEPYTAKVGVTYSEN
ncbi:MAG: type II secretion system protein [Candidatus Berkelbacteria bacterium]|nr:MAG: type II secretion system protein [Candidatus Berkelbacteria bacterium]QQG51462.1 MAG: type II secretion system protein [Candidatus Berkelbacteria bacterium]